MDLENEALNNNPPPKLLGETKEERDKERAEWFKREGRVFPFRREAPTPVGGSKPKARGKKRPYVKRAGRISAVEESWNNSNKLEKNLWQEFHQAVHKSEKEQLDNKSSAVGSLTPNPEGPPVNK